MERLDTHIGSADASLQQAPEVLKAIGVYAPIDVLDSMIHDLMGIISGQPFVGEQEVGIERGASLNMLADLRLQHRLLTACDDGSANLTTTLKDTHDRNLVFGSGASDATLALAEVHVAGLATDEGFVNLNTVAVGATHLHDGAGLHSLADTMKHKPRSFLGDAQRPGKLTGANAILRAGNQPDRGEPLFKADRRVFHNGSHLWSELAFRVGALALKSLHIRQPRHVGAATSGASDSIRPAVSNHVAKTVIDFRKIDDGFLKSVRRFHNVSRIANPTRFVNDIIAQRNPNGRSNVEVIKPWINGADIVERPLHRAIIDFGSMTEAEAAQFEAPFEHLRHKVQAIRTRNRDRQRRENWWRLGRSGGQLKRALSPLRRALVTSRVSKHRFYVWCSSQTLPDTRVVVFASEEDYFAGILHSSAHQIWFLATSSRHGVGNDPTYNTRTCFDTFPFPWPPGTEPSEADDPRVKSIAEAARELVRLRDAWLNPPDTPAEELRKRTLTKLYNQPPTWLDNAHRTLDEAVFAAYGWPSALTTQQILAKLLALNLKRAAAQPPRRAPLRSKTSRVRAKSPKLSSPSASGLLGSQEESP